MQQIILYAEVAVGVLLVLAILLQQKSAGLSADIAGTSTGAYTSSRGVDTLLFYVTIVLAVLFFGLAVAYLFV